MGETGFLNPAKAIHAAKLHEGMHVADFNAGAGFFARAAARAVGEGGVVWAVDVHREMLPRLKALALAEGLHNVEVMHGSVERPGGSHLPEGKFDSVIVANLLFSCDNKKGVAQEAHRVLRRTGRVLVIDWKDSYGGLGPHPDHVVSRDSARAIFEEQGFSRVEDIPAGAYHWGCIMRKK